MVGLAAVLLFFSTMPRTLEGTLMKADAAKTPPQITVNADRQFQTFPFAPHAIVERETTMGGGSTTTPSNVADLTPGEFLRLLVDEQGVVTRAHAVARVERARVRSAGGNRIVLENGTSYTVGSILRFVDEHGKVSETVTVRPGATVLLFHHPETLNVYRIAAEAGKKLKKVKKAKK